MTPRPTKEQIRLALAGRVTVNPSRIDTFPGVWTGAPKPGSRWTVEQFATLERERAAAEALGTRFGRNVALKLRNPEGVDGHEVDLLSHTVECPLLARSKTGNRVLVIAPGAGALLLASMLFRGMLAAQTPAEPAAIIVAQIGEDR